MCHLLSRIVQIICPRDAENRTFSNFSRFPTSKTGIFAPNSRQINQMTSSNPVLVGKYTYADYVVNIDP